MANDALAPAQAPGTPSEDEYQTFCAALSASGRGRAFLAEYARRNRGADTETLLAALARLETLVRTQARPPDDASRGALQSLLGTIRAARPEIEASASPVVIPEVTWFDAPPPGRRFSNGGPPRSSA